MALRVLAAGPLLTVQDLGRDRYERFGVPQSGAMDWFSLRVANHLVGNPQGAASLEFALQPPILRVDSDCLVAVAGHGFSPSISGRRVGIFRCALARSGEIIQFASEKTTGWGYLAVSGGIDVPLVLGSRSTYLRGGFGGYQGRVIRDGDVLPVGEWNSFLRWELPGRAIPLKYRIQYTSSVNIPVITGPQKDVFGKSGLDEFFTSEYAVVPSSDRMGYRLDGPPVASCVPIELLSEGNAPGSIQIPPGGQPIVLLSDRPATGGYAKIATVASAGLPLLVQAFPGTGRVRFRPIDVETAQREYRDLVDLIETGIGEKDED